MKPDIIELAYERAGEAEAAGNLDDAAFLEDTGRAWYLIKKRRIGVAFDADEQSEWNALMAKFKSIKEPAS